MVVVSSMARETAFLRLTQKESLWGSGLSGSVEKAAQVDFLHLFFFLIKEIQVGGSSLLFDIWTLRLP